MLAVLGVLCALLQEKSTVTVVADTPTDTAWPILGKVDRPDGTIVKVTAARVERRWDPSVERFRELVLPESRLMRSSETSGRQFKAQLKLGPTGFYDLAVHEGDRPLHAERLLLGSTTPLFIATRRAVAKLAEVCDRASAKLEELQKILAGKQPGTAAARETFIRRVHVDELLLQDVAAKTDLTASAFLLNDLCVQIRNAQVWQLSSSDTDEELNDGKVGEREVFLDPSVNFKSLHAMIGSAKTVLSREISLSAATILLTIFARAEEKPERLLARAKDAASETLRILLLAPVDDQEARVSIEAAAGANAQGIAEVRKALQAIVTKHREEP